MHFKGSAFRKYRNAIAFFRNPAAVLANYLGSKQPADHDWLFIRSDRYYGKSAHITREGWKLIQLTDRSFQLYNILKDASEYHNMAGERPEVVSTLVLVFEEQFDSDRVDL